MSTLWSTPAAGPSRFGPQASETLMAVQPASSSASRSTATPRAPASTSTHGPSGLGNEISPPTSSETASMYSASGRSASVRTASLRTASVHSASINSGRNLSSLFARRGSGVQGGRRSKSLRSAESTRSSGYPDGTSEEALEMTPLPTRHGKKRMVQEHHEARIDRRKAEAAVAKWRRWIVEQPPQAHPVEPNHPLHGSSSVFILRAPHQTLPSSTESSPAFTPTAPLSRSGAATPTAGPAPLPTTTPEGVPQPGPSSIGSPWNAEAGPSSSQSSHYAEPSSSTSHFMTSLMPGAHDNIYNTESVRALADVELAVDPQYLAASSVSPLSRLRRLSTHPRISDMENPFAAIDTLLCRRRIRPLVLELVQALGAYIDAVWCTSYPDRPCPWAGVPVSVAARRASLVPQPGGPLRSWRSWTITAVQEGKKQGFLSNPPTEDDVTFWGWEIRYGLRDIDEAINRRKDLGWAFGETVIRGQYGDIVPTNVLTDDGQGGNIPRLLNDLEEALWGDAFPAPSDLAFEHDEDFDPFSVYREGDELIGVEMGKPLEAREAELRRIFGDYYPPQGQSRPFVGAPSEPSSPTAPMSPDRDAPGLSSSPKSRSEPSPRTPAGGAAPVVADLDFSSLSALQELSMEEQLELGRRRHQEYMERKRVEEEAAAAAAAAAAAVAAEEEVAAEVADKPEGVEGR